MDAAFFRLIAYACREWNRKISNYLFDGITYQYIARSVIISLFLRLDEIILLILRNYVVASTASGVCDEISVSRVHFPRDYRLNDIVNNVLHESDGNKSRQV